VSGEPVSPDTPDAEALAVLVQGMHCGGCGGFGVMTDRLDMGAGRWLVTWTTEHQRGCPGRACPESSYLMSLDALLRGDWHLPGCPGRPARQCEAIASTTGRRCRHQAGLDGRCHAHQARP
jgi:hypothetical protein